MIVPLIVSLLFTITEAQKIRYTVNEPGNKQFYFIVPDGGGKVQFTIAQATTAPKLDVMSIILKGLSVGVELFDLFQQITPPSQPNVPPNRSGEAQTAPPTSPYLSNYWNWMYYWLNRRDQGQWMVNPSFQQLNALG